MSFNPLISIDYSSSPRIINIASPANSLVIQDLYDTLMRLQAEDSGIDEPNIATASGLEALGGGVKVGLTVTLLDALVKFENRTVSTVCKIFGGNLVSYNTQTQEFLDVPAAFSENVMVTYTSSSSATQSELDALQYSSYQNSVWVDPTEPTTGTEYPAGTREFPVNNIKDAVAIAELKGFDTLQFLKSINIMNDENVDNFTIIGRDRSQVITYLAPLCSTNNTIFQEILVTGTLSQNCTIRDAVVSDIYYLNGYMNSVAIVGNIILGGDAKAFLTNCGSLRTDNPTIIDFGNGGNSVVIRDYDGELTLANNSTNNIKNSIYFNSGTLTLEPSISSGIYDVRGHVEVFDYSTGTAVVDASEAMTVTNIVNTTFAVEDSEGYNLTSALDIIRRMTHNKVVANGSIITIYNEDDTIWETFNLSNGGRLEQ